MVSRSFDNARKRRVYLWLGTSFSLMALCVASRAAQAQEGNTAAARDGSPIVVAQQQPTPVPDVSVTAPKKKPAGGPPKRPQVPPTNQPANAAPPTQPAPKPPATRDQALQQDGTVAQGYRADLVSGVGFVDQSKVVDLPYTFNIAPSDLIKNTQAPSVDTVLSMMPTVQVVLPENAGLGTQTQSRGFFAYGTIDGMFMSQGNGGPIAIEDKERIEQLSGAHSFLYGITNTVGGDVNYVTKRPTATPFAEVTIGDRGGGSGYIHGDVSGPINDNIGYRLNVVGQGLGDDAIKNQNIQKALISGAVDVKLSDTTVLQFDASHQNWKMVAPTLLWSLTGITFPAPDMSRTGAPTFAYQDWTTDRAAVRLRSEPADFLTLRGGFQYSQNKQNFLYASNQSVSPDGSYSQFFNDSRDYYYIDENFSMYADFKFNPFGIKNTFTTGYSNQNSDLRGPAGNSAYGSFSGFNIFNPAETAAAEANAAAMAASLSPNTSGPINKFWSITSQSIPFADKIDFNKYLSVIAGGNYTHVTERDYDNSSLGDPLLGQLTYDYNAERITPSGAIIFKPFPSLMTYASYQEALAEGGIGSTTYAGLPVTNPGPAPATVSTQYEIGAKATIDKVLVTLAWFDLTKATNLYSLNSSGTSYTFNASGKEEHKGVELGLSGKVTDNLTLYGGVTAMNTKIISNPSDALIVGQNPAGVSNFMAKLYGEYSFNQVPGFVFGAGVQYYSRQLITNVDYGTGPLVYTSGYAVGNLGVRYKTKLHGYDTTYAVNIDNFTNTRYWQSASAAFPGEPLTARFSATVRF